MIFVLSAKQLERLSELFIDIAKGVFLSALAVPIIDKNATFLEALRTTIAGLLFTYLSLKATELQEAISKK